MRRIVLPLILLLSGCNDIEKEPGHTGSSTPDNVPVDRAAEVSAIMAAEGITVGDVATFVAQYGFTVIPGTLPRPHWSPAPGAVYYVATIQVAVGDTALTVYMPDAAATPYTMTVVGYDEQGRAGPRSEVGWSDNGDGPSPLKGIDQ